MCRILITGIAEPPRGDEAFGVAVARRLARRPQPQGVEVVDFGVREVDLAYAAADGYDAVVLVHGTTRDTPADPLAVTEAALPPRPGRPAPRAPGLDPRAMLELVHELGGGAPRLLLIAADGRRGVETVTSAVEALARRLVATDGKAALHAPPVREREPA